MFRFLFDGEAYEIGDEYYDKVTDGWRKVSLLVVGVEHIERSSGGRCFARRKISDNFEAEKPAHNPPSTPLCSCGKVADELHCDDCFIKIISEAEHRGA